MPKYANQKQKFDIILMQSTRRKPDFNNLLKLLRREKPDRPTLFEFFLNDALYSRLAGEDINGQKDDFNRLRIVLKAFRNAGFDYATVPTWLTETFEFPKTDMHQADTRSLNEGNTITDEESFEAYPWPDPAKGDYEVYNRLGEELEEGMKLIGCGPCGVLENVVDLVGFERICLMTLEDPELTKKIFDGVGARLLDYYKIISDFDAVGALIVNDDWGFKSQTMFPTETMRQFVIPWHQKIVEAIHAKGKPAIMHSCGNLKEVMDDIIDVIEFDGKHSFEDGITPVEEAIYLWGSRIAIIGGIDMDYLASSKPEDIYRRAKALLEKTKSAGGYALGSGNSIPDFIPDDNFFAMTRAALE